MGLAPALLEGRHRMALCSLCSAAVQVNCDDVPALQRSKNEPTSVIYPGLGMSGK